MRETSICPKCGCDEILQVAQVPDTGEYSGEIRHLNIATIFAMPGIFDDWKDRAGALSAAVCRQCGYAELYAANPQDIPVDGKYVALTKGKTDH